MSKSPSSEPTILKVGRSIPDALLKKVIEDALRHRNEASASVKKSLDDVIPKLNVKGFRSPTKAPLNILASEIFRIARLYEFPMWSVLRGWMENSTKLAELVRRSLSGAEYTLYSPAELPIRFRRLDSATFEPFVDAIRAADSAFSVEEIRLMFCCTIARYVSDSVTDSDDEKEEIQAPEADSQPKMYGVAGDERVSLDKWLQEIEGLSIDAPEWDELSNFVERVGSLAQSHVKKKEINDRIAAVTTEFAELIGFFRQDSSKWNLSHLAAEDLDAVRRELEALQQMLQDYATLRTQVSRTLAESRKQRDRLQELEDSIESGFRGINDRLKQEQSSDRVEPPHQPQSTLHEVIDAPLNEGTGQLSNQMVAETIPADAPDQSVADGNLVDFVESGINDSPKHDSVGQSKPLSTATGQSSVVTVSEVVPDISNQAEVRMATVVATVEESTTTVAVTSAPSADREVWNLIGRDRISLAFQINRCLEHLQTVSTERLPGSTILKALALSSTIRHSASEAVDLLAETIDTAIFDLSEILSAPQPELEPSVLLVFAATLRPTLIAPSSRAAVLLETLPLSGRYSALERLRESILDYLHLGVELTPAFLKGERDHSGWMEDVKQFCDECDRWLREKRQAKIIYAPTTEVWRNWLEPQGPLGKLLSIVIENKREQRSLVEAAIDEWADMNSVYEKLSRTDRDLRQRAANRRPIEARAKQAIFKHTQEAVARFRQWVDLLSTEPHSDKPFINQEAEKRRNVVLSELTQARAKMRDAAAKDAGIQITAACKAVERSLNDIGGLFDPILTDTAPRTGAFFHLCSDLMRIPGLTLDERWNPTGVDSTSLLKSLLELSSAPDADWRDILRLQTRCKNHLFTKRIIEYLADCSPSEINIEALRLEREENLKYCISELKATISEVQAEIGRMVLYGLLPESALLDLRAKTESITPEQVLQFGPEYAKLDEIRQTLKRSQDARIEEVRSRLQAGGDRYAEAVVERVKRALDAGEFHAANEYLDMADSGEMLPQASKEDVFINFFPNFVGQIIQFLSGTDSKRERLDARSLISGVRDGQSLGPLDMQAVTGEQADAAAQMLTAWFRLKNKMNDLVENLTSVFSSLGFDNVRVHRTEEPGDKKWWGELQSAPIADRAICVIPQFGSLARGRYQVLCLWDRPSEEEIINTIGKRAAQVPTIVLYLGQMPENRRRELAHLARERKRPFQVLLVDETLMLFMCGQTGARLPVLFKCTAPFAFVNPYTTTAGLVPIEMFFGRSRERQSVIDRFGTNLVYGGRQLGKTALLRDVERHFDDLSKGSIVKWIDLRSEGIGVSRPIEEIWSVLSGTLMRANILKASVTNPETVAKRVTEWITEDAARRIVLLLDEADAFLESEGKSGFQNLSRLKGLMDSTDRRFKVVFAGLHNVQRTSRHINSPLAHLGQAVCIGPLLDDGEHAEALALITEPLETLGYRFENNDLSVRILSHTNYYPSLIQLYCKHLIDHLANPRRHFFSPNDSPVYQITSHHLEEAQNQELRVAVLDRFRLTLDLDPRYRLIALCIALNSSEKLQQQALVRGVDVNWVREEALSWWPEGFRDDSSLEAISTILDEMIGLGILRHAEEKRYALRSPNLLNLLGTQTEIEYALLDASTKEPPTPYEAFTFHRSLPDDPWRRSPLTAEQESKILSNGNGVAIIFGTRLAGMDEVIEFLRLAANSANVICPIDVFTLDDFNQFFRETLKTEAEGQTVILFTENNPWTTDWVVRCVEESKRRKSKKRSLRFIFLADTKTGWSWTRLIGKDVMTLHSEGLTEVSLKPWSESALRNWIYDIGLTIGDPAGVKRITDVTGNWTFLLHEFGLHARQATHRWREHLQKIEEEWLTPRGAIEVLGLAEEAVPFLRIMAMLNEAATVEEICHIEPSLSPSIAHRALAWADRFSIVASEGQGKWRLDPVIQRLLLLT